MEKPVEKSPKGALPYGWSVHVSTKYPSKVYYFNSVTGDTTWELPKLDPPRALPADKDKEVADLHRQSNRKDSLSSKSSECCSPEIREDSIEKSAVPPTAVVAPVVHKSKKGNSPAHSSEKRVTFKRKSDSLLADSHENETKCATNKPPLEIKKKKHVSPLNKPPTEEISDARLDRIPSPSVEQMSEDEMCNNTLLQSATETSINDVEMQDVSSELLDDLNEKKETVFDTSACYYIVVDTNVLIGELDLINELKDTPLDGCGPPHIFIPWVVIEELDKLKSQKMSKVGAAAAEAIRFLNSVLGKHPRFHGQSPAEAEAWVKTYSKNNDDKILECCVGLSNKMPAEKVILLTNDKNLVNKALICEINVHNFESMIAKVKPDTKFNCEEMKSARKRKKENEVQKEPNGSQIRNEEKILHSKRDKYKREIHNIMSNARQLLKDVLYKFFSEEMLEAYGDIWVNFPIEKKLLKGVLDGILKYWRVVFNDIFTERDKRNIELLLEKVKRPEGFLGDKDECLVILSAVEDLFRQIKKRQPKQNVPVELIQEYRVACVNAFIIYSEAESELRLVEDQSVREVLDDNWTAINQLCGIIMDHYEIPHDFDYYKKDCKYPDMEIKRLMVIVLPAVQKIKRLLCQIFSAVKKAQPVKSQVKKLVSSLLEFIPSLNLPYDKKTYPFFNTPTLERWLTSLQNREKIERGIMQIEKFLSKLDEAFLVIVRPCSNISLGYS